MWTRPGAALPRSRRLSGITSPESSAADSITCDAHKWFSVPMGAGMFFCRHADAVAEAFHAETTYMPEKTAGPVADPYTTSVQWSRRFIGLKLFLALAQHGESGYVEMIEHQTSHGRRAAGIAQSALAGGSSTRRRCRWCASPATGSTPRSSWQPCMNGRSRGCRKSGSAKRRSGCAGMHHQFSDNGVGHRTRGERDEPAHLTGDI